jgi:SagB-type dehydrogenase family enzyme
MSTAAMETVRPLLRACVRATPIAPGDAAPRAALVEAGARVALPAAAPLDASPSLDEVIARRRSGGMAPRALDAARLAAVLEACVPPPETPRDLEPLLCPIVLDVDGVAPGAYRFDRETRSLVLARAIDRDDFCDRVLLQSDQRDASVIVFLVAPLAAWLRREGDAGYRSALVAVGWMTDQLYLLAELAGTAYTATGGFAPALVDDLLGADGAEWASLFAFALSADRAS